MLICIQMVMVVILMLEKTTLWIKQRYLPFTHRWFPFEMYIVGIVEMREKHFLLRSQTILLGYIVNPKAFSVPIWLQQSSQKFEDFDLHLMEEQKHP